MNNYLVVNQFYNAKSFEKIYSALQNAFSLRSEKLEMITNLEARKLVKELIEEGGEDNDKNNSSNVAPK